MVEDLPANASFQQLKKLWRERVERAYQVCLHRQSRANQVSETVASLESFGPDETCAILLACSRESTALKQYIRVLKIYTDLLVHGIKPDDVDSPE